MCEKSADIKRYADLVEIYDRCHESWHDDPSDDLRIDKFVEDMKAGSWTGSIVIRFDGTVVVDGIHRGIAYLKCVNDGLNPSNLPPIQVIDSLGSEIKFE
jgi:hypothetical protein